MKKDFSSVGYAMATTLKHSTFYTTDPSTRKKMHDAALNTLEFVCASSMKGDAITFEAYLSEKYSELTDEQKTLIERICTEAFSSFQDEWLDHQVAQLELSARRAERGYETAANPVGSEVKAPRLLQTAWHGGSGYTGRLKVGLAAPHGSESYRLADEPRMGLAHWVKAITAGGFGPGHSLSELSGAKQPKSYDDVISADVLVSMRRQDLLGLMDKATNPGNFLRAMLAYYGHPWVLTLENIGGINSANINNPENIRSMTNLDVIFRYMDNMDTDDILTPERSTRFLVLCNKLLSEVKLKEPRTRDRLIAENYKEQSRALNAVKSEIESMTESACLKSKISEGEMLIRISADRRSHLKDYSDPDTPKPGGTQP